MTIAADTLHAAPLALTTALATLTADGATPTSLHVSTLVSTQASISVVQSTGLSTQNALSLLLSTALSTLTADAGSPTSAHVSTAVLSNAAYQAALSAPAIINSVSVANSALANQSHLGNALSPTGGAQINLGTDLSTAIANLA